MVEVGDLLALLSHFGCISGCEGDLNGDQAVGISDLLILLGSVGSLCPY